MMNRSTILPILLVTAFALAGCGGGSSGGGVASMPPPPTPPPTSAPAIIPAATTSQQFAAIGSIQTDGVGQPPVLDAAEQLQVRYVASSNLYEARVVQSQRWSLIKSVGLGSFQFDYGPIWLGSEGYNYSRLLSWFDGASAGSEAIGMATPAGGVPVAGTATYLGDIIGLSSAGQAGDTKSIGGTVSLNFDFGLGSLTGSISPQFLQDTAPVSLGTINFRDTVYSTGGTTFSGKFDTNLAGVNSFSGLFTGPNAQELIGNFAFPFQSPIDDTTTQAHGAFVGKKP